MIVKYFAWIKNITNKDEEIIKNSKVRDIDTLKKYLIKKYPKLEKYIIKDELIRISINQKYIDTNKTLKSNDEIALFPPVSGG